MTKQDPVSISSTDLGLQVGLSQSTISRIRHGKREPGPDSWFRICEVLGVGQEVYEEGITKKNFKEILDLVAPL